MRIEDKLKIFISAFVSILILSGIFFALYGIQMASYNAYDYVKSGATESYQLVAMKGIGFVLAGVVLELAACAVALSYKALSDIHVDEKSGK